MNLYDITKIQYLYEKKIVIAHAKQTMSGNLIFYYI